MMGSMRALHSMSGYSMVSWPVGIIALVFVSTWGMDGLEYMHIGITIMAYAISFTSIVNLNLRHGNKFLLLGSDQLSRGSCIKS